MAKNKGKAKEDYFDDGRTIVKMDVEGMPWVKNTKRFGGQSATKPLSDTTPLSKSETRILIKSALLASLAICAVFIISCVLFISFLLLVWGAW